MSRVYKTATIYEARIFNMKNLWEPSHEFMGRKQEKPNYYASVIIKKTRSNWFDEPILANFTAACSALYNEVMSAIPFAQIDWPIKDGDIPDPVRGQADWRVGQWLLTFSSMSAIDVSIIQNGTTVPLKNRMDVKPGDYVGIAVSVAQKATDPRGVKCFGNKLMFMRPGDEIVIGASVSATDLMAQAKAQGFAVTGFGGGAPQQGFTVPPGQGFAQTPVSPAPPHAPAPFPSAAGNGNASSPSSPVAPPPISPPQGQGFGAPSNFNPPTGFPQR